MKKNYKIIIITNIVLGLIKFSLLELFAYMAFNGDYAEPVTKSQRYLTFFIGVIISITLDFIVNFLITKTINKNSRQVKFIRTVIISVIITILEALFIFN